MMTIFSENPENDLWRELMQFTYKANIKRYFDKKGLAADDNTINCIAGSFLQAFEYYKSAKDANLQISPLLLYYGSSNLLYGMANLLSGSINKISNHGMKIFIPNQMKFIADTTIRFLSPVDGGVHVIARALGFNPDLTGFGDWVLKEFLDSIAEISSDYAQCYEVQTGCVVLLDVFNTPDGKAEKIYFSENNKEDLIALLGNVEGFNNSYLRVMTSKEYETGKEYFVLRHKLTGTDISEKSFSGQPYLRAAHNKNSQMVTVPTILNMYISLFALASLCRYFPEKWSPFVLNDTTGEKLLIEKFMYYARRQIPNYVLNKLLENTVQYSSDRYTPTDTVKLVGEHQVQEMVERKVKIELERTQISSAGKR